MNIMSAEVMNKADNRRANPWVLVLLFGIAIAFFVASFFVLSR